MSDLQYRLVKHFVKPELWEYVPIECIEMMKETVAWSPKLNQSIYITPDIPDAGVLKRVREVNVLRVINHISGSISTIELTEEEKKQFEDVHKVYQEKSGQIVFSRKKIAGKPYPFLNSQRKKTERKKSR
ncbi:hypothetical protein ig2599ANME_0369 [groundwater metagenome]